MNDFLHTMEKQAKERPDLIAERQSFFRWLIRGPLLVFLIFLFVAALLGYRYLTTQIDEIRTATHKELLTIADLKAQQIALWYQERKADGEVALNNPMLMQRVRHFVTDPDDRQARAELLTWMAAESKAYDYARIDLCDVTGNLLLTVPTADNERNKCASINLIDASRNRGVVPIDLHRNSDTDDIHLDFLIPVPTKPDSVVENIGFLIFRIDPNRYLFPLVQAWPTLSDTAETLLVRREGDDVVYLNELRHRKNTALKLRFSIDRFPSMPAVQGILGKSGIVEEKDYRESQVLAALKNIPGTPWLMVAKVDQDEVYAALRVRIWITGLLFIALFSITALALGLQWRRHDNRWLRRQLEAEREIHRQRKIAEEEIRKLNAELEQRVRERTADLKTSNEELESFTYSVAHDLRAPLRGIDGWSLALQEDYGHLLDENGRRYMERVRSESQRMGRLIDDLLQLSRIAQAEVILTPVNLTAMANAIALRLKEANPERQAEFLISPALTARGDAHLLEVALYNLIENAWKFTGKRSEARIEVGRIQENGQAIFFVRDNGAGFDMAYSGRLFGAFQRLHKSSEYPGTGVGLATVQRIIRRHSGRVWAEAQQDQGATFYFTFQETQ